MIYYTLSPKCGHYIDQLRSPQDNYVNVRERGIREWRRLQKSDLHNFYSSQLKVIMMMYQKKLNRETEKLRNFSRETPTEEKTCDIQAQML
jgi:hypothetical protein